MKRKKNSFFICKAFLINLAAGILAFSWTIIMHGGLFSLAGDFNVQQIPFAMYANDAIKAGNVIWDWSLDLGSNFIGGQSFYVLGNPSFWISMLFPSEYFMYVVGWIYVLKYAVAGLTSCMYLIRYVKHRDAAVIGSMLYAFCGFMAEDLLFYHFHDVLALFPLMLLTMDDLMEKNRRGPFIFAVAINALTNYYFLVGEIIFLVAYFIIRFFVPLKKKAVKGFFNVLFEGICGGLITCILLLPSFLFVIQNPRVTNDYTGSNALVFSAERYLFILKGLLFPGEVMSDHSAIIARNFASCNAYLPVVGLVLVIAFFYYHKESHWVKQILKFCLIMAVVPILNASFSLFAGLYHRWFYMPALMMTLASAMMLDEWITEIREEKKAVKEYEAKLRMYEAFDNSKSDPDSAPFILGTNEIKLPEEMITESDIPMPPTTSRKVRTSIRNGVLVWGLVAIGFISFCVFVKWSNSEPSKIYRKDVFAVWSCVCLAGILLTYLILCGMKKKQRLVMQITVFIFSVFTTVATIYLYQQAHGEGAEAIYDRLMTSSRIEYDEPEYRFTNKDQNIETLTHGFPTSANFCSTVSGSIFRFYESLGLERDVKSPEAPDGMMNLISAKYTIEKNPRENQTAIQEVKGETYVYYVYENNSVPPIGFTYETYMTASEFAQTADEDKAILMLKTLVIPDDKESEVSLVLRKYSEAVDGPATGEYLTAISTAHMEEASKDVKETTSSFESTIISDNKKYAFFSIPNDSGWKAYVNGNESEILDVNGFMAVRVDEGENRIRFEYTVPGLSQGIVLSIAGLAIAAVYILVSLIIKLVKHVRRKKESSPA